MHLEGVVNLIPTAEAVRNQVAARQKENDMSEHCPKCDGTYTYYPGGQAGEEHYRCRDCDEWEPAIEYLQGKLAAIKEHWQRRNPSHNLDSWWQVRMASLVGDDEGLAKHYETCPTVGDKEGEMI